MGLKGKVALVTGASKGIGAAIAERLAADGAAVAVNYGRSKEQADAVVKRITAAGGKAVAIGADVTKLVEIEKLFAETAKHLGPLDVLVNNAGVYEYKPLAEVDEKHIDWHFDLNVKALLLVTREAVKAFGERGGRIINISSVVAQSPVAGGSVYSATKGAVDTITRGLAQELAPKQILVNAIAPGLIETDGTHAMAGYTDFRTFVVSRTALGREGRPDDIANVAAFLASSDSAWMTGQILYADGGLRA